MFCLKCGTQLPDEAIVCSSCGCNLNSASANSTPQPVVDYNAQMIQAQMIQAQQYQMQRKGILRSEIATLSKAYTHFNLKRAEYQEYDKVSNNFNHYLRGARKGLLVWGIIILVVGTMFGTPIFNTAESITDTSVVAFTVLCLIPGGMMTAGGVLMQVINKVRRKQYESKYISLSQELNDHYNAYSEPPIGIEYSNPEIIEVIMNILKSGRADTIKEAINLMISEANQVEMAKYLQNIQAYAQSAASSAKTSAVFAAASFFIK